jgi:hypothetical protein
MIISGDKIEAAGEDASCGMYCFNERDSSRRAISSSRIAWGK